MKAWNKRTFLYINGELHRKLQTNKSDDLYTAQEISTGKVRTYSYAVVRDTHEKAYNTKEVGEMLGRSPRRIRHLIKMGVTVPQKQSYNSFKGEQKVVIRGNETTSTNTGRCEYYFKPEEIHDLRDYFASSMKYARTDKRAVPTKAELKAMMDQSVVLYMKNEDGTFVPTWQAKQF